MREVTYGSHGVPLEEYQLNDGNHCWQRTCEEIRRAIEAQAVKWRAEEDADPALLASRQETVLRVWSIMRGSRTADYDIMRWRVRLYCGHIVETRRHRERETPTIPGSSSSMKCPECGRDPSTIVAYEPLGLAAERPGGPYNTAAPAPRRPTRAQLERRVAELEAETKRLRRKPTVSGGAS